MRINSLTKTPAANSGSVCSVKHQEYIGNFERVKVTMDSGAIDPVIPTNVGLAFKLEETYASKNGIDYKGPNDSPIKNHGQRKYQGFSEDWTPVSGAWQVADVNKVLGSVDKAVDSGNTVVFDAQQSFVYHKPTQKVINMYREGGEFKYDMWIPRPKVIAPVSSPVEVSAGQFGPLNSQNESRSEEGFQRQDPL